MPPKKSQRKSMPGRINKAPTLTPSRRSPRVPPPSKSSNESAQPAKTLDLTSATPQDNSINIRFYTPKPSSPTPLSTTSSPSSRVTSPETPSSRRRAFQSRPSRLSTVYTPIQEPSTASQGSRRTRRTAALETPKQDISDLDFPETTGTSEWTFDQYMGSFESEETVDGPSSPTSASDMRNSSRIRKPTMRAIESLETTKKQARRKISTLSSPTVESPDLLSKKVAKNNVSKQPTRRTRTSKRVSNLNQRKAAILIGFDIDVETTGMRLFELSTEALSPNFTVPLNFPEFWEQQRSEYFRRQDEEKYGVQPSAEDAVAAPAKDVDVDMKLIDEDLSSPSICPSPPTPPATVTNVSDIRGYKRQSEPRISSDGWVHTGHVNSNGEEVELIPEQYHPYCSPHTYGSEKLPFPPVCARSNEQANADLAHGFPPLMGERNIPFDGMAPFITENVDEEKARVLARTPAPAPATKKPRVRKRRQTTAADATVDSAAVTETGGRKSQRRRRKTAPLSAVVVSPSPSPPPTTATQVKSPKPTAAVTPASTKAKKPKVQQRLKLTLKPAPQTETSGKQASGSTKVPAVQSPSSPASSGVPSPASSGKRRRRKANRSPGQGKVKFK